LKRLYLAGLLLFASTIKAQEFNFVDSVFCPLICDPIEDQREGFLIDILRDALAESGHTLNFQIVPYKRALNIVSSGEADGLPAIYRTDAPDLLVGQSTISLGRNQFFIMSDTEWRFDGQNNWDEIRIAVVRGYTFGHTEFDAYLKSAEANRSDKVTFMSGSNTYERMVKMLISGRVDAILDDSAFIYYSLFKLLKDNNAMSSDDMIITGGVISEGENVVAYSPANPEVSKLLKSIIDPFVSELYRTGRINDYVKHYGLTIKDGVTLPIGHY